MLGGIKNTASLPELRRRLIFTFLMLAVYRVGVQIPTPGINGEALASFFEQNAGTGTDHLDGPAACGALTHLPEQSIWAARYGKEPKWRLLTM